MRAMIFAAGVGSRLKPFTDHHPKALAEVGGEAMLGRVITKLKKVGISDFTINIHHFAQQIIDYLRAHDDFGVTIHISDESGLLLDTGGALVAANRFLRGDEPVIIHNADIITDADPLAMLAAHREAHADATLLVEPRDTSRYLLFDSDLRLCGWKNIRTGQLRPDGLTPDEADSLKAMAFGGVHIIEPRLLDDIEAFAPAPVFSIIDFYIDYCSRRNFHAWPKPASAWWHDIGNPKSLEEARHHFAQQAT